MTQLSRTLISRLTPLDSLLSLLSEPRLQYYGFLDIMVSRRELKCSLGAGPVDE